MYFRERGCECEDWIQLAQTSSNVGFIYIGYMLMKLMCSTETEMSLPAE
jgi:hypothetical protein